MTVHPLGITTDPGTEILDLDEQFALLPAEAESWLDVPAHVPTPDLARLIGFTDYEWTTWLVDALKAGCVPVLEHPGWKTRGRPRTAGPFMPRGVMIHHDASAPGPSPAMARFIAQEGRPAEGIPAPLSQLWLCLGCDGAHAVGTWHVLAAGRANHAGEGDGWGSVPADMGNTLLLGVEIDHAPGEPWPAQLRDSLVRGSAALLNHMRSEPDEWMPGHREYAPGRKTDPAGLDMAELRRDVAEQSRSIGGRFVGWPGASHFTQGHQCKHGHVRDLEQWLLEIHPKSKHEPSDTFTKWTANAVAGFQADRRALAGSKGMNAKTWRAVQAAARAAR